MNEKRPPGANRLGKRIKDLRLRRRESWHDFALAVGATMKEIRRLEEGRHEHADRTFFLLNKIALHGEITVDDLLHAWAADAGEAEPEKGGRG